MATQQEVIKTFMASLDNTTLSGTAAVDEAIRACSDFNSLQEVIDQMVSDCRTVNNAKNFLLNYCGINLDNDDTGAITGWDAGGSVFKDAEDIVPETGELINFTGNSFTVKGLTLQLEENFDDLTDSQKFIWQGLYTWWAKGALDLIAESYGNNFGFDSNSSATVKKVCVDFSNDRSAFAWFTGMDGYGRFHLVINNDYFENIDITNPNGESSDSFYSLDRLLAHELTHGVMSANIYYFGSLPQFIKEGMAELTHGTDDYRESSILNLAGRALSLENIFNGTSEFGDSYAAGYILLRYLAKQAADEQGYVSNTISATVLNGTSSDDKIRNNGDSVTVYSSSGNDVIGNEKADYSYIDAGIGNDYIYNESDYVTIYGGAGNDTIKDSGNCDTIYGGDGDDLFIKIYGTIYGGAGNDTFLGWKYGGGGLLYGDDGDDLFIRAGGTIDGGAGNDTINVLDNEGSVDGGSGNDFIIVKYTNDTSQKYIETIRGGLGNDTIDASNEKPVWRLYQYAQGDGDDLIIGFTSLDTLEITSGTYSTTKSGNNLIVNVGSGSITIKDIYAENTKIHIKDAGGNVITLNDWSIMSGTSGADSLYNAEDNITISGLSGNDTITNYGSKVSISGGTGDDSIINSNSGEKVTIEAGNGNDYISGGSLIYGGLGNDTISGDYTIYGGDGNDYISGGNSRGKLVDGGEGNDSIKAYFRFKQSLVGGAGNDLFNLSMWVLPEHYAFGEEATINGGTGNDTIEIYNGGLYYELAKHNSEYPYRSIYQYTSGDGNDIVEGFTGYDKISITGGSYSTIVSGNDIIVRVGSGSITLKNAKNIDLSIDGTFDSTSSGNDTTPADTLPVGISISNSVLTASSAFTGNEINLADYNATKVNVSALSQAVNIVGTAANNSLRGGSGKDTISGGSGNDTLTGGNGADIFIYSSGNDVITDYAAGQDKIKLSSDSISSASVSGNNVILKTANGNITIQNGKNKNITVIDSSGNETTKTYPETTPADTTPADDLPVGISIKNSVLTASAKFTGTEIDLSEYDASKVNASALSQAVTIIGSDSVTSIKGGKNSDIITGGNGKNTISGSAGDDSIIGGTDNDILKGDAGADTISGGLGKNTLTGGAGADIFVHNGGNDIITDYKPSEDKIQFNVADIESSTVKGSDVILTTGEGTISIKGAKDKVVTFIDNSGATTDLIFFADTYYAPLETGLTYDAKRTILTASNKFGGNEIDLENYLSSVTKLNASAVSKNLEITATDSVTSIKAGKGADTISGGNGKNTISGGAGNDSILSGSNDDKLLGEAGDDTLNGGIGKNTLTGGAGKDIFVYAGGNDLITDYKTGEDKIKFNVADITSSTVKSSDVILTTADGTISIKGAKDKVVTFTDDSGADTDLIFFADTYYAPLETGLTYDAKRTILTASNKFGGNEIDLENYLSSVTKLNASAVSKNLEITATDSVTSIKAGKGADTISGGNGKNTISGGAGNDSILSGSNDDKLLGEAGDDTLNGGIGKNTLTGGAGKDIFVYAGGNDLITDYKTGEDKIKFNIADITSSSVKSSDVILTTADGTISIKGAKDKVVTFTDDSGADTDLIFFADTYYAPLETGLTYDAKRTVLTAGSKFEGTEIDLENYLSTVTKVKASSAKNAVEIVGNDNGNSIKGGKGADTINGGSGNDTLTGGAGNDIFIYAGGNDLITDYKTGEDKIQISGTISETSYSGKDVIFTVGDGNLTVKNAKGKDITVTDSSGSKTYSKTLNLIYDNNFATDEFELDSIADVKVDVTEIQTTKTETFAQDENILTYSENK